MSSSTQRTSKLASSRHGKLQSRGDLPAVYANSSASRSTSVASGTGRSASQTSIAATSVSSVVDSKAPGARMSSWAMTPRSLRSSKQPAPFDEKKWSTSVRRQYMAANTVASLVPVVAKFRHIVAQNPHWANSYNWEGTSNAMQALSTLERVQKELWKKWCGRLYELDRTHAGIDAGLARLSDLAGPFAACDKALRSAQVAGLRMSCLQTARDMANLSRQRLGLPLQPTATPAGDRPTPADIVARRKRIKAWTVRCKKAFKGCRTFTELGQQCLALEKECKALQREHPDARRPNYARDILWGEFSERKGQLKQRLGVPGNPNDWDPNMEWAPWHLYSSKPLDLSKATFAQPGAPARPSVDPAGLAGSSKPSPSTQKPALAHSASSSPVGIQNSSKSRSASSTVGLLALTGVSDLVGHNSRNLTSSLLGRLTDPRRAQDSRRAPTPGPDANMYRGRHYPLIEEDYERETSASP